MRKVICNEKRKQKVFSNVKKVTILKLVTRIKTEINRSCEK